MPDILPTVTDGDVLKGVNGVWTAIDPSTLLPGGVDDIQAVPVAAVTILADLTSPVAVAPFAGTIAGVEYFPTAAITGADSPASRTFTLYNRGQAGSGTTAVATIALTNGVNAAANDAKALTLSAVEGALTVADGDLLDWESLHVGATGLVDPGGLVRVRINRA